MTFEPKKPSKVLETILTTITSVSRRNKLSAINALCEARFQAGEQDFSISHIGRLCEAENIISARGLYNKGCEAHRDLIGAWAAFAEPMSVDELKQLPEGHPEVVLRKLLAKGSRAHKQRSLRALNDVCRKHHATSSLDFGFGTVGNICEQEGILKRASLKSKDFEDHRNLILAWDAFARPWHVKAGNPILPPKRVQKAHDLELTWVARDHPALADWQALAVEWLKGEKSGLGHRMAAIIAFFDVYLTHPKVPKKPRDMLLRGAQLPDFKETACPGSSASVSYNNCIHEMINWVLLKEFSFVSDDGARVISPDFRNPVSLVRNSGGTYVPSESVRRPLPYGYIEELRHILATGQHFRDWKFAQQALGADIGEKGAPGRDWFDVTDDMVDRDDPDCVLRVRPRYKNNICENVLQMWSPVRWVAVLVKLIVPMRTAQVRLLDSGEFDMWVFAKGKWSLNSNAEPLVSGGRPRCQGVLRRKINELDGSEQNVLYVNTNKTADIVKDGPDKGLEVEWHTSHTLNEDIYYWLEKLRDWQMKYNPISCTTHWAELDARHIPLKSQQQLSSYPKASFLFRLAEGHEKECHLPITDAVLYSAWCNLLENYQERLAARGELHANGSKVRLVFQDSNGRLSTQFPMHSLRVSLVTAFVLDGAVPFPIMQKLVGHSRLLMTLYYTKPGAARIKSVLTKAAEKLSAEKEKAVSEFLLNAEYEELVEKAVCNSQATLAASLPEHPASRNAAGWMLLHIGLCLVGGNASELEDNNKVGGCYNGGANLGSESKPLFGPVPGGSRNCIRCRWFVTEPHYLPSLAAHFNTLAYHFDEARNKSMAAEQTLQELKREKARKEVTAVGPSFMEHEALRNAERLWETSIKRFSDLAEDLVACWRLIERCQVLLDTPQGAAQKFLVHGAVGRVRAVFEETESELLQLSGVCENLELYPDLEADKAVIRRSQLLDSALYNEGVSPMFMRLSEREQLLVGNAFLHRLAISANPENPILGKREVIELIDAGKKLSEHLGIDLGETYLATFPNHLNANKVIPITRIVDEVKN